LPTPHAFTGARVNIHIDQIAITQEPKPVHATILIKLRTDIFSWGFLYDPLPNGFERHDFAGLHHVVHVVRTRHNRRGKQQTGRNKEKPQNWFTDWHVYIKFPTRFRRNAAKRFNNP